MEKMHIENGINDSIFVISSLLDNNVKPKVFTSMNYFPFNDLYNKNLILKSRVPRKPVLIARNSTKIVMKIPPF